MEGPVAQFPPPARRPARRGNEGAWKQHLLNRRLPTQFILRAGLRVQQGLVIAAPRPGEAQTRGSPEMEWEGGGTDHPRGGGTSRGPGSAGPDSLSDGHPPASNRQAATQLQHQ